MEPLGPPPVASPEAPAAASPVQRTARAASERFPPEWLQVLTHFYRGEVQRSTDWRKRLDTTTNWAIIATTATFSWAFSTLVGGSDRHIIFLFTSLLVFLLMCIEARRYRYYDLWHTRVRMLEVHLLVPALHPELKLLQGDWRSVLSNDLLRPAYKISIFEALARRLQQNYIWLYLGLTAGWALRVYTGSHPGGDAEFGLADFYQACGYGVIRPWQTLTAIGLFWGVLGAIVVATWRTRHITGEVRRRDRKAKQWPI